MLENGMQEEKRMIARDAGARPREAKGSYGLSLMDLLLIILERKWFLLIWMSVISVGSVIGVMQLKSYYTATAKLLPFESGGGFPLGALMGGDMPAGGLMKGLDLFGKTNNDRFLSILGSRRLAERVIDSFKLEERYGFKKKKKKKYYFENVLKEYYRNVVVFEDNMDNIVISVTDSTPQVAADMANFLVDQVESISFDISKQSARGSRVFFEQRLDLMQKKLDSVHQAFADFQVANNFIDLEQQVKSSIEALAGIEAEAMATDIEKEMLASNFGSNSRMMEVTKKKNVLNRRMESYMQKGSGSLVLPLKKTPELAIKYQYLYRDVKINEALYAFLVQMYEQAKFKEVNNSPTVSVLEKARVPQKRAKPKRMALCLVAFVVGFSVLGTYVLLQHWYRRQRSAQTDAYLKLRRVTGHFRPSR